MSGVATLTQPGVRRLSVAHFSFMRALIQGLDLRASWDRFLGVEGESSDLRTVKSTVTWIRDEFAAAAKRENKAGTARLILLDATRLPQAVQPPSLDEFAAARGMEDWFHDDKMDAYTAAFGPATKTNSRRSRLVQRQLEALRWLERLVAQRPGAGDGVEAWFPPNLAERLKRSGLASLSDVVKRINGVGARWWTSVPGVGQLKASRILEWLREQESSTGLAIGRHVSLKRSQLQPAHLGVIVPPATSLVPLEKFVVPATLNGEHGALRAPVERCAISARNDYDAITAWLNSKRDPNLTGKSATHRAYRKEAERLLLWAVLERQKPMSSLMVEDVTAYKAFLVNPPASWCGPSHHQRWSPLWRPLTGPMGPAAVRYALIVLRSLGKFLLDQNYLVANPFAGVSLPRGEGRALGSSRSLTGAQWDFIERQLDARTSDPAGERLALAVRWLYGTGLRLSEMCAARCGDLRRHDFRSSKGPTRTGWLLEVTGKGDKVREVPVSAHLIDALRLELARRGADSEPTAETNQEQPVLATRRRVFVKKGDSVPATPAIPEPLSASGLARILKDFLADCSEHTVPADRERLRSASAHWLRHTHGTHAVNGRAGILPVPIQVVQNNLGHSSLATTSGYLTTELETRLAAMEGFGARER